MRWARAAPAGAQTFGVPDDWELKPADLAVGDSFRVLFVTSTAHQGQSTDIAHYNRQVQTVAAASTDPLVRRYASSFRALASTAGIHARTNTMTQGAGDVPIYWLNGERIAENYDAFYDRSWDSADGRDESGRSTRSIVWTGTNDDGSSATYPLGDPQPVSGQTQLFGPLFADRRAATGYYRLFGMSPVLVVEDPTQHAVEAPSLPVVAGLLLAALLLLGGTYHARRAAGSGLVGVGPPGTWRRG